MEIKEDELSSVSKDEGPKDDIDIHKVENIPTPSKVEDLKQAKQPVSTKHTKPTTQTQVLLVSKT